MQSGSVIRFVAMRLGLALAVAMAMGGAFLALDVGGLGELVSSAGEPMLAPLILLAATTSILPIAFATSVSFVDET